MNSLLSELLVSPKSGEELQLRSDDPPGQSSLVSSSGERYPIIRGIPRFVTSESFSESFGFQWNRFEVRRNSADEVTLQERTGVRLSELKGQRVLDAGCGGGRYSLVAAEHGARVIGVDRSRSVEKAQVLALGLGNLALIQADLNALPLRPASFDLVMSIGVLHHSPDTRAALGSIAAMVKPGGRLSVWIYRRNLWPQEVLNNSVRSLTRRLPRRVLLGICQLGAVLGGVPLLNRTLNKLINFSNHPYWENRVCDNFDWYASLYQHHHTPHEICGWFEELGFCQIVELKSVNTGKIHDWLLGAGLIIGSGVNVSAIRK